MNNFAKPKNIFEHRIAPSEYLRDPFEVAQQVLLGSYLCSNIDNQFTCGKITELEVYIGAEDKACHAYPNKKTNRNAVMFETGGKAYVFFVYGKHHQFNVVTNDKNTPNAILIRSLEPICGIEVMRQRRHCQELQNLTTGPGKLCQALGITRLQNGLNLNGDQIWISPKVEPVQVAAGKRVGIDYAQEYRDKPWRFVIKDNLFISKPLK